MSGTPTSKFLVLELAVFIEQGIGKNRICKHVLFTGFADDFHEYLLHMNQIFDVVDRECTVRELGAAEQRLQVPTVKNGNICKS